MIRQIISLTTLVLMLCTGCTTGTPTSTPVPVEETQTAADTTMKGPEEIMTEITEKEIVLLTLEDGRTIKMELYPEIAPLSVDLFLKGVETGYYNGKVFHRAVPGFMIQGGSQTGDGIGGMDETIKGEFLSNGVVNNLSHKRGVVSLARTSAPNSASGQFFIMHDDGEFLDGNYAAFGYVIDGMDVVDEIAEMPTDGEMLIEKPVIKSMEIIEE